MKYRVYMTVFGFFLQDMFDTYEEALQKAKSTGFEFRITEYIARSK